MEFAQRLQLRQAGVPISDEDLVEAATLQDKNKVLERMQQQKQQASQLQQQQMQMQMQEVQSKIQLAQARSVADQGLGLERVSRVQENEALAVERRAAAEKDHDAAFLDLIKALKEIDTMDISHIRELIQLSHQIKAQEAMIDNPEMAKSPGTSGTNMVKNPTQPQARG
jgi:hypothetical protein